MPASPSSPASLASPPTPSTLPTCVSLHMVMDLVRCLARPRPGDPPDLGRQAIATALWAVACYQPRDGLEALLVTHLVLMQERARQELVLSASFNEQVPMMLRVERQALALQRAAGALERQLRSYRRGRTAAGEAPAPEATWTYDLTALEAVWRNTPRAPEAVASKPDTSPAPEVTPPAENAELPVAAAAEGPALSRQMRRALARQICKQQAAAVATQLTARAA